MTISIGEYMTSRHKHCDELFIAAETAVYKKRWDAARAALEQFCNALEQHLAMEEEVLFPAVEAETGVTGGPTSVMRAEHQQARSLLRRLEDALTQRDVSAYLSHSETLNIMLQQHDLKEESVLYPMIDSVLSSNADELIRAMSELASETEGS